MGRKKNNRGIPPPNNRQQQKPQPQSQAQPQLQLLQSSPNIAENKSVQITALGAALDAAIATPISIEDSSIGEAKLKLAQVQESVDTIKASLRQLKKENATEAAEKSISDDFNATREVPFDTNTAKRKRNRNRKRNKGAKEITPTSDSNDGSKLCASLEQQSEVETTNESLIISINAIIQTEETTKKADETKMSAAQPSKLKIDDVKQMESEKVEIPESINQPKLSKELKRTAADAEVMPLILAGTPKASVNVKSSESAANRLQYWNTQTEPSATPSKYQTDNLTESTNVDMNTQNKNEFEKNGNRKIGKAVENKDSEAVKIESAVATKTVAENVHKDPVPPKQPSSADSKKKQLTQQEQPMQSQKDGKCKSKKPNDSVYPTTESKPDITSSVKVDETNRRTEVKVAAEKPPTEQAECKPSIQSEEKKKKTENAPGELDRDKYQFKMKQPSPKATKRMKSGQNGRNEKDIAQAVKNDEFEQSAAAKESSSAAVEESKKQNISEEVRDPKAKETAEKCANVTSSAEIAVLPKIEVDEAINPVRSKAEMHARPNITPPTTPTTVTPTTVTPKQIRKAANVQEDETSRVWKILEEASKSLEPVEIEMDDGLSLAEEKSIQPAKITLTTAPLPVVTESANDCRNMEILNSVLLKNNLKETKESPPKKSINTAFSLDCDKCLTATSSSLTSVSAIPVETQLRKTTETKKKPQKQPQMKDEKNSNSSKAQRPSISSESSLADVEIPLDMSIISNASAEDAVSSIPSPLDDAKQSKESATDSKNVRGSDFVPSVEQSLDESKSLVVTVTTPIIQEKIGDETSATDVRNQSQAGEKMRLKRSSVKPKQAEAESKSKSQNLEERPKISSKAKQVSPTKTVADGGQKSFTNEKPSFPPKPDHLISSKNKSKSPTALAQTTSATQANQDDDDEEVDYIEYKFMPRQVFICSICQACKASLQSNVRVLCPLCQMVTYCSTEHMQIDTAVHKELCTAIQEIAKKRGGHIYNNARVVNSNDYRSLRVHTLNICENLLKRPLQTFEREIILFPRVCGTASCREWRQNQLSDCSSCHQVIYCTAHPEHLIKNHQRWCKSFQLYEKLVVKQSVSGRIEPMLPTKIISKPYALPNNIDDTFKDLYENYAAIKDVCMYATITQLATAPLTAYFAAQNTNTNIGESFTIHLVGAELQFEADILDVWETFFLHLSHKLIELTVVFCGPELNAENVPLDIISRIRMCRTCRQNCRIVKFDFQCAKLYHEYVNSNSFKKPDLVCFFNPGLYRVTGFNGLDTWPETIKVATSIACPIVVTSYTEYESPRDLERFQLESTKGGHDKQLTIVHPPQINHYSSQRPERNFISDEVAPLIFKNFYCFILK